MSQPKPETNDKQPPPNPIKEIVQPFIDLVHAPRALWGINLAYLLEGMVYFGMLGYLAMHFSDFVFQGVPHATEQSHNMVMVLTAGITLSMFGLGFVPDRFGVRPALLLSFVLMLFGRVLISAAPTVLGLQPAGLWSPLHLVTMGGILLVVIGYGMYQPAAYAGVRQVTTPKTSAMGFAMLYALMNLGGWLPSGAFLLRDDDYLGLGIPGTFWVYTAFTVIALAWTAVVLSRRTMTDAIARAKAETEALKAAGKAEESLPETPAVAAAAPRRGTNEDAERIPLHMWGLLLAVLVAIYFRVPDPARWWVGLVVLLAGVAAALIPSASRWVARHPLADLKFFVFIFALIPVQTLFTYNWLVLPQYISRAFDGWIAEYFEIASNANPLLIFVLVPLITAATQKSKVYSMMIAGTFVMAAPAFLLAIGPHPALLLAYIVVMTIGEAMWQPRFLQYAAELAPEGRTGVYMGVAQLPWFLTKVLVPLLYSGWMMDRYCPPERAAQSTGTMWLIFGFIAISSPVILVLLRNWLGRDFKTAA